jgi:hypothetical protein
MTTWQCTNCKVKNPTSKSVCLVCGTPYMTESEIRANEIERQEKQKEQDLANLSIISSKIREKTQVDPEVTWEYCIILSGAAASEQQSFNALVFLNDPETIELPGDTYLNTIGELGLYGWELVSTLVMSGVERQYPVKDLRSGWNYLVNSVLNAPRPDPVYEYEAVSEAIGFFFIFKRPIRKF